MQHASRDHAYRIESAFYHGNTNCRNSLQKQFSINKSSDELYERIRSPIAQAENNFFIYPNANYDCRMASGIHNGESTNNNVDNNCDTAEAVTRFDQENSADSDPESYLHSNSDLEENKNNFSTSTEKKSDISN